MRSFHEQQTWKLQDAITLLQATSLISFTSKSFELSIETMNVARAKANDFVKKHPELMCEIDTIIADSWSSAIRIAATGNQEFGFPDICPWSETEMLTENWMPELGVRK